MAKVYTHEVRFEGISGEIYNFKVINGFYMELRGKSYYRPDKTTIYIQYSKYKEKYSSPGALKIIATIETYERNLKIKRYIKLI